MSLRWLDRMTDGSPFSLPFDKIFYETSGLSWVFLQQRTLLNTHLLDTHRNSRHHCDRRVVGRGTCHNRTLMYHPHYLAPQSSTWYCHSVRFPLERNIFAVTCTIN